MVEFINNEDEANGQPFLEFHVYRSPRDNRTVLGYYNLDCQSDTHDIMFAHSPFGVPATSAFEATKHFADEHGIRFILIVDREGLFMTRTGSVQ